MVAWRTCLHCWPPLPTSAQPHLVGTGCSSIRPKHARSLLGWLDAGSTTRSVAPHQLRALIQVSVRLLPAGRPHRSWPIRGTAADHDVDDGDRRRPDDYVALLLGEPAGQLRRTCARRPERCRLRPDRRVPVVCRDRAGMSGLLAAHRPAAGGDRRRRVREERRGRRGRGCRPAVPAAGVSMSCQPPLSATPSLNTTSWPRHLLDAAGDCSAYFRQLRRRLRRAPISSELRHHGRG